MEEIGRSMKKAFLDWLKKFRRNSSTGHHVPEYQSLKLKLLPLGQAEEATHPYQKNKNRPRKIKSQNSSNR
jgi:hypothetical protein